MRQNTHVIVLRPEHIKDYPPFQDRVIDKYGALYCHSIKHGDYFLEVEAHLAALHGPGEWFQLLIHHSAVLYVVNLADENVKQILGFRASQESVDTPKD